MSKTISADSGAVTLTSSGDNALTILAGVTVSGSSYGVAGNSSLTWTITNQGTVIGAALSGISAACAATVAPKTAAQAR